MKTGLLIAIVAAACLCAGVPQVYAMDFSADIVMTSAGQTNTSKVFVKGTKMRMDQPGRPMYTIMRGDKDLSWIVMTDQKAYMEAKSDPKQRPATEEKVRGEVSRKLIGNDTVDGRATKKYEVTYKDAERTSKMYQWIAPDIKFPVKSAAIDGSWTVEYRNVKMGSQPDSLFEIPAGYKKMAIPSMPGMPGAGSSGKLKMPQLPR
jgi:hypothetical protein